MVNPEAFAAKLVDEVKVGKHDEQLAHVKAYLCDKFKCTDVKVAVKQEGEIIITLVDTTEEGDNIVNMVFGLLNYVDMFLTKEKKNELKEGLSRVRFEREAGRNDLDVVVPIGDSIILDKIKEVL
jgi:hypothetical protein